MTKEKSLAESIMPKKDLEMLSTKEDFEQRKIDAQDQQAETILDDDEPCPTCGGEGVIPKDEYDEDSNCYQLGVGTEPCPDCHKA